MAKYLEWYLVELERNLAKNLRPEDAFALLCQTEDHLCMIKQEFMAAGMDEARAEQAAILRFGQVENLAGKPAEPKAHRGNFAAPTLIILGAFAVVGAALWFGSYASIIGTAAMAALFLIIAALLCARKGAFPGLAFGIVMVFGFAGLSGITGLKFYGQDLDFLRRSDSAKLQSFLLAEKPAVMRMAHLARLGNAYVESRSPSRVPRELRGASGILYPLKDDSLNFWSPSPRKTSSSILGLTNRWQQRFFSTVELGRTNSKDESYSRWRDFIGTWEFQQSAYERPEVLKDALSSLRTAPKYEAENVFLGIALGSFVTLLWVMLAFSMNRLANFKWDMRPTPEQPQRRVA